MRTDAHQCLQSLVHGVIKLKSNIDIIKLQKYPKHFLIDKTLFFYMICNMWGIISIVLVCESADMFQ